MNLQRDGTSKNKVIGLFIFFSVLFLSTINRKKRIFISFAIEDKTIRDLLVGQTLNSKSPFNFVDKSVYDPWEKAWKTNCRSELQDCDGVIALISKNTVKADGQLWEIKCAKEEQIPLLAIHAYKDKKKQIKFIPNNEETIVKKWDWKDISNFISNV